MNRSWKPFPTILVATSPFSFEILTRWRPKRRGTRSQVTSTFTSPWTRSSAGCYVSSLKNIKARDMLINSTSITSCWRENQSWNSVGHYVKERVYLTRGVFNLAASSPLGIGAKNLARTSNDSYRHEQNCHRTRNITQSLLRFCYFVFLISNISILLSPCCQDESNFIRFPRDCAKLISRTAREPIIESSLVVRYIFAYQAETTEFDPK